MKIEEALEQLKQEIELARLKIEACKETLNCIATYFEDELNIRASWDVDLTTVLSDMPRSVLIAYNQNEHTKESEKMIYVSDVVKAIRKDGRHIKGTGSNKGKIFHAPIVRIRGLGYKAHDEIMKYVSPHL